MSKVSIVSELFVTSESLMKCLKCGNSFKFSINKNVYIRLDKGSFVFECPHCNTLHKLDLDISLFKEIKNEK